MILRGPGQLCEIAVALSYLVKNVKCPFSQLAPIILDMFMLLWCDKNSEPAPDASVVLQELQSPVEAGRVAASCPGGGTIRARLGAPDESVEEMTSPSEHEGCEVLVRSRRRS